VLPRAPRRHRPGAVRAGASALVRSGHPRLPRSADRRAGAVV